MKLDSPEARAFVRLMNEYDPHVSMDLHTVIESIIEQSGTPYFAFKDIDENKPTGSIRIRVETINYFLKRYAEAMQKDDAAVEEVERQIAAYEAQLRRQLLSADEFADVAARQQEAVSKARMLPVIPSGGSSHVDEPLVQQPVA